MTKSKDELEKEIMDVLVKLYSDQQGCEYEYHEVKPDDKTA